jgi:hypothetical protein
MDTSDSKTQELKDIVRSLEDFATALGSSEMDAGDYGRGWLNGAIANLSQLIRLAEDGLVTLN